MLRFFQKKFLQIFKKQQNSTPQENYIQQVNNFYTKIKKNP